MNKTEQTYHVPVLLHESIEGMHIQPKGIYVDVTFGGGGHSKEILRQMDKEGCSALTRILMRKKISSMMTDSPLCEVISAICTIFSGIMEWNR